MLLPEHPRLLTQASQTPSTIFSLPTQTWVTCVPPPAYR